MYINVENLVYRFCQHEKNVLHKQVYIQDIPIENINVFLLKILNDKNRTK